MFRKRIASLVFLWALLVSGCVWFFHKPGVKDYHSYQRLMEYSDRSTKRPDKESKPFATQQQRYHVTKQFFFVKDNERLQWRLKSESSELKFGQQENAVELIEYFKDVSCLCQEKLVFCSNNGKVISDEQGALVNTPCKPKQLMRCLNAKQAVYHYKTEQLIADDVQLARYMLPGHQWIDKVHSFPPIMTGQAKRVQLSFSQKDRSFKAQGLQAAFQDWSKAF